MAKDLFQTPVPTTDKNAPSSLIIMIDDLIDVSSSSSHGKIPDVSITTCTFTDSAASTPGTVDSLASSISSDGFHHIRDEKQFPGDFDWSMHPIHIARNSFLNYLEDNIRTLVIPRERYMASFAQTSLHANKGQAHVAQSMATKLANVCAALEKNSQIAKDICREVQDLFPVDLVPPPVTSQADEGIARSTIRQLWRDWSAEAEPERKVCFDPILDSIRAQISNMDSDHLQSYRVLVPGAGLCRLAHEIAKVSDFPVIANELSYHQILATHWVLNQPGPGLFSVSPWATQFSNHVRATDQFRSYAVPEAGSTDTSPNRRAYLEHCSKQGLDYMSLRCGNLTVTPDDFRDYAAPEHSGTFSCVVTAFFLDTAPNVLDYVSTIKNILKPGGTWLNVGPLLWNCFENGPGGRREGDGDDDEAAQLRQASERRGDCICTETTTFDGKVELAWDEILELIELMGFDIEENVEKLGEAGYILDRQSMLLPMYQVGYFKVSKRE